MPDVDDWALDSRGGFLASHKVSMCSLGFTLVVVQAGCRHPSRDLIREEAARLRVSVEKHRAEYLKAIETENRLALETLEWLNGAAVVAPRGHAIAEAREFTDRWARVYFVPRYMHAQLRFKEYSSPQVRAVQRRLLDHLRRRYVELHDYQRYAQHASESAMHRAPAGRLPKELEEFRYRLQTRAPPVDEIRPLLESLPK